jgi:DNA repair photolyase
MSPPAPRGRGSHLNPPNRFTLLHTEALDDPVGDGEAGAGPRTQFFFERSRSIVTENASPDIPFRYSINPYRGCEQGCPYCYARPTHEYLGLNAGLDFETKIVVKENAPELFRDFLARDAWEPEPIVLSGVTDCYQPCERRFRLTRACLEVAAEARQPMSLITKNALLLRDLDLLRAMAAEGLLHVNVSVTTLDAGLARSMEPRTSAPAARLRAVRELAEAGVPVRVMVAPVIPGLNDNELPAILRAAREAGARAAGYQLLRLPLTVAPVFLEWLQREQPARLARVEGRVRDARGGKLNNAEFGKRMRGTGEMARQIGDLFKLFARRYGLDRGLPPHDCSRFRPPLPKTGQLRLF